MNLKFEFTDEKHPTNPALHRIRALVDIPRAGGVRAGDLGGWVEDERNLTDTGAAWVYGDARVYGNARVSGNARVYGDALVYGDARVYGDALVYGDARVYGDAQVSGDAQVLHTFIQASDLYRATLFRTKTGHQLIVGCWHGTVDEFRAMALSDKWVEATPEQIEAHRPELLAFADLADARIKTWEA